MVKFTDRPSTVILCVALYNVILLSIVLLTSVDIFPSNRQPKRITTCMQKIRPSMFLCVWILQTEDLEVLVVVNVHATSFVDVSVEGDNISPSSETPANGPPGLLTPYIGALMSGSAT